ncbi:hypothetical protein NKN81_004416 [Salmonella enterica]|nr:hypothetical protein [Salmonella enterica]
MMNKSMMNKLMMVGVLLAGYSACYARTPATAILAVSGPVSIYHSLEPVDVSEGQTTGVVARGAVVLPGGEISSITLRWDRNVDPEGAFAKGYGDKAEMWNTTFGAPAFMSLVELKPDTPATADVRSDAVTYKLTAPRSEFDYAVRLLGLGALHVGTYNLAVSAQVENA